jgi:hypothetical protein
MTRREVAFLAIGLGFSGLVGSLVVAWEYGKNITDWQGFYTMLQIMGLNPTAFVVPAFVLLAGLVLLATRTKSVSNSN